MSFVFTDYEPYNSSKWRCVGMQQNGLVGQGYGSSKDLAAKEAARQAGDGGSSSDNVVECTLEPYDGYINSWRAKVRRQSGRKGTGYGQTKSEALRDAFSNAGG